MIVIVKDYFLCWLLFFRITSARKSTTREDNMEMLITQTPLLGVLCAALLAVVMITVLALCVCGKSGKTTRYFKFVCNIVTYYIICL